jgi:hypothetical protein
MTQVTLVYHVPIGVQRSSAALTKVQAVNLQNGELSMLQMAVVSDVSAINAGPPITITRTLVLSGGDALFTTAAAKKDATRGLYTSQLGVNLGAFVTADEPVVA